MSYAEELSEELSMPLATAAGIGKALIEEHGDGVKFYIPKFVTRGEIVRMDGYIGVASSVTDRGTSDRIVDMAAAWTTNIMNLPWLYPILYFNRADSRAGLQRLAPALKETLDILPTSIRDIIPPVDRPSGDMWKKDRRAWLLGRLQRHR